MSAEASPLPLAKPSRSRVEPAPLASIDRFEDLIRRNELGLRQFAYRLLGTREEMEDALQEACLRAFRAAPRFQRRHHASPDAWLYRVLYRTCMDRLRERRRTPLLLTGEAQSSLASSDDAVVTRLDVERALAQLPPQLRAVSVLVDVIGLDYATTAKVVGVRPGTVASRLSRARAELRANLDEDRR